MEFALLVLGAYRLTRLVGWDTITGGIRKRLTGWDDEGTHWPGIRRSESRATWQKFLHCPWCVGWWVGLLVWASWLIWPHATLVACTPLAINALVGLVTKNLDE